MDDQLAALKDADRSLFPSNYTIRALRDSRYHNTAYAIAELLDNSIEAHAEQIELLCMEKIQRVGTQQMRPRVSEIAVLDNGTGMDARTLLNALKFGGGTRHHSNRGIGKYGMGLPTSSMSQCKKVDVWTGRVASIRYGTPASTSTLSSRATTVFPCLTKRHRYLRHGERPEATKSMNTDQARSSCGATWTRFNGKPPAR